MHSSKNNFTSAGRCDHLFGGSFEERDHSLPIYRGKPFQKLVNRIARFKIVEECLHRHARPRKTWRAPHDVRIC